MVKPLKTGLKAGQGPPPGFHWNVDYLSAARDDALGFLNDEQYAHAVDLVRALASELDPTHPETVSVDAVEDFFELRDKGGVLGKINLRVFFTLDRTARTILILASIKKEADGPTPIWAKVRVRNRLRRFRDGAYRTPQSPES